MIWLTTSSNDEGKVGRDPEELVKRQASNLLKKLIEKLNGSFKQ